MSQAEKTEFKKNPWGWRIALTVASVAALFSLIVCVLLVANYLQIRAIDPLNNPQLIELHEELAKKPGTDEELAEKIRVLDLLSRKAFFTSQDHLRMGALMLLFGVAISMIGFKLSVLWKPELPTQGEEADAEDLWYERAFSRQLITAAAVLMVSFSLIAAYLTQKRIETMPYYDSRLTDGVETSGTGGGQVAVAKEYTEWEEVEMNWPTFRGPGAYGVANVAKVPTEWDGESGHNVRWKVKPPLPGFNSPVVWENRVFLSGANEQKREVYCYDADTGDLLWQAGLEGIPPLIPEVDGETGFAASTLVVHGDKVCAIFATGELACFDFDGNQLWYLDMGLPDNHYGHSSSLIAYQGLLFVQFDANKVANLFAFDIDTGEEEWVEERKTISWASPVLLHTDFGVQLILNSEEDVDAYEPLTGELLWTQTFLSGEVAPSPAYSNGVVFSANDYAVAAAVKLSGTEGAVQTEIMWEWDGSLPDISSPVGDGSYFYIATSYGEFVCVHAETGEEAWTTDFDEGFYASPILVGDLIYALDIVGTMQIFSAGGEFKAVSSPKIPEEAFATPAFADGRIYIRGYEHLYCIEEKDE